METNDAIKEFMQRLALSAYASPLNGIRLLLRNGPIGTKPLANDVKLHEWFENLSDTDKAMVEMVIKETADRVLFGSLVVIDNLTIGYPIEGVISDFALYVQSYPDKASRSNNQPKDTIRINHPKNNLSLYDLLSEFIKK